MVGFSIDIKKPRTREQAPEQEERTKIAKK